MGEVSILNSEAAICWCVVASSAALSCLLAGGCGGRGPQGLGVIDQVPPPRWDAEEPDAQEGRETQGTLDLGLRVNEVTNEHPGLKVDYSPDAGSALLCPGGAGTGEVSLYLVTERKVEHYGVQMVPGADLAVLWSRDSAHVVVYTQHVSDVAASANLGFVCLSLTERRRVEVRTGQGPPGASWYIGAFSTDCRKLFAMGQSRLSDVRPRAQIWSVDTETDTYSLLFTQPPVRFPRGYDERLLLYAKPVPAHASMAPSRSGALLAFNSYPTDNYLAEAIWLVNLRTGQARQVTWERRRVSYAHTPVEWQEDDRCILFVRHIGGQPAQFFTLTLDSDLWKEGQQP